MLLTEGQEKALKMAVNIAKSRLDRPTIGVIVGFAGSGKTSLFNFIEKEIGNVLILSYTGKAAVRVMEATGLPASTIHRWCFRPHEDFVNGGVYFTLRKTEEVEVPSSKLIIIDEASMLDSQMFESIYKIATAVKCNILAVGDNAQLPPVTENKEYFNLLDPAFKSDARVELTEIVRQALDSPIIKYSFQIRNGKPLDAITAIPRVYDQDFVNTAINVLNNKGVVVCHTNKTRHIINQLIRKTKGYSHDLVSGEPLLVLRNTYGVEKYNGEVLAFNKWNWFNKKEYSIHDGFKKQDGYGYFGRANVDDCEVILCPEAIHGKLDHLSSKAIEKVGKHVAGKKLDYLACNFGYALSVHKSQGSEFHSVLIVMEPSVNVYSTDGRKFFYTALTRAKKEVYLSWNPDLNSLLEA